MAFKGYEDFLDGGMAGIFTWVGAQKANQMV
jgi:heme exporter protein D